MNRHNDDANGDAHKLNGRLVREESEDWMRHEKEENEATWVSGSLAG